MPNPPVVLQYSGSITSREVGVLGFSIERSGLGVVWAVPMDFPGGGRGCAIVPEGVGAYVPTDLGRVHALRDVSTEVSRDVSRNIAGT